MGLPYEVAKRLYNSPGAKYLSRVAILHRGHAKAIQDNLSNIFQTENKEEVVREVLSALNLPDEAVDYILSVRSSKESLAKVLEKR